MQETDLTFDGVAVRMYEPVKRSGVLPGIVYFHGGGFVFGNLGKNCGSCFMSVSQLSLYLVSDAVISRDVRNRFLLFQFSFGSVLLKNTVRFGYYSYLLLV